MSGGDFHSAFRPSAPWREEEPLECTMVIPEAPGVASFCFRAPSGAWFDHAPGQFLTLELPLPTGTVHRTFTISSSPSRPLSITITVKAQEVSLGTRWMLDHLTPGTRVRAFGPAGVFTLPDAAPRKYLFISAGSGITPMLAMTTWIWDSGFEPDIAFVHCARRPQDLIFRQRLEHMASRTPGLKLHWVVKEDDPYRTWTGYRGRFNQLMLGLMAPDYLDREVFCCGPESFMQSVRDMLNALGYDMARYHQESFHAPAATEAEVPEIDDVVPSDDRTAELHFTASGVTATCRETDTVLTVARASGLNIPSGCTFGVCGTCKVRKTEGEVVMVHSGGIADEDIEAGYILACCSRPIGRVSVEI
ncbi:2Fe-2S iron-sulfur cluster binding domain-containing protein [Frigidibacter albus]|uniref:2Fe-2S iron-sulfur cluster binding domain-containing protein n=1 Tax=Frigidibacter albus TaxID=1465486 RepID=A0A6L8VF05_9RHOB|nr:hybrid-cluster NAD(P)-dependent oxidoreductase [Frigidibacter albus]MZQ87820.1 2Fe-2S iron-sulfur cluster binding domain-containing protein [Frigidibacter albus]NBE29726.1 2Fe-2S iron-sulfur cluster binding domain-containing protein [Frigidibacter albus]GGH43106.1 hybrid-cluster NAD(P)-dependent oxidoreductase [Frigidibacter albus]